ncbi:hypothetical protein TNCV_2443521 [Trichonephila clavipes]|nr:hypothetical protein TNCV_2443521 [Trichonephila clavipes]
MNFFRGRCQGSHQELRKERGFSERTLDAEVDDPGLKKKRRERWPSRDPPNRCSQEAGSWRRSYFERNNNPSKNKLEKSAAFKDDPDFVMNLLNLSVEDRHTKSEQQLQVINSQLELEKIKLKQIEREMELARGQATQQNSKGDSNNLENLVKSVKTMKSGDKDTGYTVNQIETSIPNQNNFLFNELQYVDVIVDDTPLSATLDSGANSVIMNSKY